MGAAFLPDGRLRVFRRVRALVRDGAVVPDQVEAVEFVGGVQERRTTLVGASNARLLSDRAADRALLRELGALVPATYRFLSAGAATAPYFTSRAGGLVRLDATTGARQVVLSAPNRALAAGEAGR